MHFWKFCRKTTRLRLRLFLEILDQRAKLRVSTGVKKNYDLAANTYGTSQTDLAVAREA
jgi:hypothetical protein